LQEVYGVENINTFIIFEKKVKLDNINFIDANIPSTKVLIEQKNIKKDLHDAISQSDGSKLTPFQQAQRYVYGLPVSEHPRWIVTCNFKSFLIYDMERPNDDPQELLLENLPKEYNRLNFLVKTNDEHEMLIEAIKKKDKRMYLRVIKAHISRIFNELDKLKGIYPQYFEKE
jgi:hypothetical protein